MLHYPSPVAGGGERSEMKVIIDMDAKFDGEAVSGTKQAPADK